MQMRYCSTSNVVIACSFSFDLEHIVFVTETRDVYVCNLTDLKPEFQFHIPSSDENLNRRFRRRVGKKKKKKKTRLLILF